jgi:hypothetical protein
MLFLLGCLGAILGVWGYLMCLIFQQAFTYDVWVDGSEIDLAAMRVDRKYKRFLQEAQILMVTAEQMVSWGQHQLKAFDNADLHRSLNDLVRTSWPKKTTTVYMVPIAA